MSLLIRRACAGLAFAGLGFSFAYINRDFKTPRSAAQLPPTLFHGTRSNRMPPVKIGETFEVKNHFFFIPDEKLAIDYAKGKGVSAFRPTLDDPNDGHTPVLLQVTPVDPENTTWKRGLFGGDSYFDHGAQLRVVNIHYPKIDIDDLSEIEREQTQMTVAHQYD